jgi:hypothetical protein
MLYGWLWIFRRRYVLEKLLDRFVIKANTAGCTVPGRGSALRVGRR